jgi:hypothetical protein
VEGIDVDALSYQRALSEPPAQLQSAFILRPRFAELAQFDLSAELHELRQVNFTAGGAPDSVEHGRDIIGLRDGVTFAPGGHRSSM